MNQNPKFQIGDLLATNGSNIQYMPILALVVKITKFDKLSNAKYELYWIAHHDIWFRHKKTYLYCNFVDKSMIKVG